MKKPSLIGILTILLVCNAVAQSTVDMVPIPGGEFEMGDHWGSGNRDELPVHAVYVESFCMSTCEITNGQYCQYLNSALGSSIYVSGGVVYGSGNSQPYCDTHSYDADSQIDYSGGAFSVRTKGGRDMSNDPMVEVAWYGAVAYCNWRSQQEGKKQCYNLSTWQCNFSRKGYRLPTEAEWEYAARGGLSSRRFPWGDTITHSQANYHSYWSGGHPYYPYDVSPTRGYHPTWNDGIYPYTAPVGSFQANGYGLYDMAGNVWEWCNDWYSGTYYSSSPLNNPTGPTAGTYCVLRDGCWYIDPSHCRVAFRYYFWPDSRYSVGGFRVVRSVEPPCELIPKEIASMNVAHDRATADVYDGKLYVCTGYTDSGPSHYNRTPVMEMYDPDTDTWTRLADIPQVKSRPASFLLNGNIYVVGGETNPSGSFTKTVHRYDPQLDTWMQVRVFPWSGWGFMGATCNGKAYVLGGRHGYGRAYPHVYQYDDISDVWLAKADMPYYVYTAGTVCYDEKIYVFCGNHQTAEGSSEWVKKVQIYDPTIDTWQYGNDIPWLLNEVKAVLVGDAIWLFANQVYEDGQWLHNEYAYKFSPPTGEWTRCLLPFPINVGVDGQKIGLIDGYAYFTQAHEGGTHSRRAFKVDLGQIHELAGPIVYWSFDDAGDPGHDDSDHERDLMIPGPWSNVPAVCDNGIHFEQYAGGTNWGSEPLGPCISTSGLGYPGPDGFTVAFWARLEEGTQPVVQDYWQHVAGGMSFCLAHDYRYGSDNNIAFAVWHSYGSGSGNVIIQDVPAEGEEWVHMAGTYDPDGYMVKLYINGQVVGQDTLGRAMQSTLPPYLYVCGNWHGTIAGTVDEVYVYDRALSASEIEELAEACEPTTFYPVCWNYLTQCYGDSDNSGDVKGSDFLMLKSSWYECYGDPDYDPCADFNRSGCVDGADFLTLKSNWYESVPTDCTPGDPYGVYQ